MITCHRFATASEFTSELAAALRVRLAVIADRESYARDPRKRTCAQLQAASEKITVLRGQTACPGGSAPGSLSRALQLRQGAGVGWTENQHCSGIHDFSIVVNHY